MLKRIINKIGNYQKSEKIISKFFDGVHHSQPSSRKILQYVGISSFYLSPSEILLYHLLKKNGFDVDYFIYGDDVPINEIITLERENIVGKEKFWRKSNARGRRMLRAGQVKFNTIPISNKAKSIADSLPNIEAVLAFELDGIHFGDIVSGTMYRYYKALTFGQNAEDVAKRMLITALSNYFCIKSQCENNQYDAVIFSHGIYVTWQPVVEYCKRNNVDFICYDRAKTKDHANFNVNQPAPNWNFDKAWNRYAKRKLTDSERGEVHKYLKERELQKGDVYAYNFGPRSRDLETEKERLGIPPDRKCVTIFTNLIWDAANTSRDIAFPSALDCATKTIEYFRDNNSIQVIVRAHPAEKVLGTSDRYLHLVKQHFGDSLPSNTTLLSPEDNVNSFTVIDLTDVGIVNTSTVGLEMAVLGKPVVLISETHYREKGFTIDVTDEDHYFTEIERALEQNSIPDSQRQLAEKYFFIMMFLYQQRLPAIHDESIFVEYCSQHFNSIKSTEPIVQIAKKITQGIPEDFIDWP